MDPIGLRPGGAITATQPTAGPSSSNPDATTCAPSKAPTSAFKVAKLYSPSPVREPLLGKRGREDTPENSGVDLKSDAGKDADARPIKPLKKKQRLEPDEDVDIDPFSMSMSFIGGVAGTSTPRPASGVVARTPGAKKAAMRMLGKVAERDEREKEMMGFLNLEEEEGGDGKGKGKAREGAAAELSRTPSPPVSTTSPIASPVATTTTVKPSNVDPASFWGPLPSAPAPSSSTSSASADEPIKALPFPLIASSSSSRPLSAPPSSISPSMSTSTAPSRRPSAPNPSSSSNPYNLSRLPTTPTKTTSLTSIIEPDIQYATPRLMPPFAPTPVEPTSPTPGSLPKVTLALTGILPMPALPSHMMKKKGGLAKLGVGSLTGGASRPFNPYGGAQRRTSSGAFANLASTSISESPSSGMTVGRGSYGLRSPMPIVSRPTGLSVVPELESGEASTEISSMDPADALLDPSDVSMREAEANESVGEVSRILPVIGVGMTPARRGGAGDESSPPPIRTLYGTESGQGRFEWGT